MDAPGFDFIEDNGQKPVTKFLEGWIEQVMQASDDIVVLHEGKWFLTRWPLPMNTPCTYLC